MSANTIPANKFSEKIAGAEFGVFLNRRGAVIQRKEYNRFAFGGYQIHEVVIGSRIANEWIDIYNLDIHEAFATVTQ